MADALDSGSSRGNSVQVQVLLSAPTPELNGLFSSGVLIIYTLTKEFCKCI